MKETRGKQMQVIFPDEEIHLLVDDAVKREIENQLNNINFESLYLNKRQTCKFLGISNNTLDSWIQKGLPVIRVGKTVRFNKIEINRWLQNQ
jgi:DNA-binding helix-turn-helix protein